MTVDYTPFEGYVKSDGNIHWNQSYYYNAYDPVNKAGVLIRIGLQEQKQESNSWLIVFKDGKPLYTRTNINLPYISQRPADGLDIAGMHVHAEIPLKRTRITFQSAEFSFDLVWNELHPIEDCVVMSQDKESSFATEIAHVHLEGTSTITGKLVHRGQELELNGKGFRDIAAGPRNWDALLHYRLAWPIFDNGMAFAGVHGFSVQGQSSYLRMFHDGKRWLRVKSIDDNMEFTDDGFAVSSARWSFVDEQDRKFELTGKPLFSWLFPVDTFVVREQIMEYRLADGTVGFGLYETGYRLPWTGISGGPGGPNVSA